MRLRYETAGQSWDNYGPEAVEAMLLPDYEGVTPLELLLMWQRDRATGIASTLPVEVERVLRNAQALISKGSRPVELNRPCRGWLNATVEWRQSYYSISLQQWRAAAWWIILVGNILFAALNGRYMLPGASG